MLWRHEGDAVAISMIRAMTERGVQCLNHTVCLSVHDTVSQWRGGPLRAGMVIVVEPMIWLENAPHPYVCVEDTVVGTDDGCERLTAAFPWSWMKWKHS